MTNYIKVKTNISDRPLTFLIDTGADISVINVNSCKYSININRDNNCIIAGITENTTNSMGSASIDLYINDSIIQQEFQVLDNNYSLLTDGILGRNFLIKNLCSIDFDTFTISITSNSETHLLDLNIQVPKIECIQIPPRSQIIQVINIQKNEDIMILSQEISKGVFIGNTIVAKKGLAHINILNTTDKEVNLKELNIKSHPLDEYNIVKVNQVRGNRKQRFEELLKELKLDIKDPIARNSILEICKEFSDCFHLSSDRLSYNNFYEQDIEISDNKPIYIKNYRFNTNDTVATDTPACRATSVIVIFLLLILTTQLAKHGMTTSEKTLINIHKLNVLPKK